MTTPSREPAQERLTAEERRVYYTPGEVARIFGVTPRTVANWCDKGLLQFIETPSGHRRILASSIKGGSAYDEALAAFQQHMTQKRGGKPAPSGDEIAEKLRAARLDPKATEVVDAETMLARLQEDQARPGRQSRPARGGKRRRSRAG